MRHKFKSAYGKLGITIFLSGCALILFFFTAQTIGDLTKYIFILADVIKPFIIGFVLAYLMCPIYNACMRRLKHLLPRYIKSEVKVNRISRIASLFVSFALLITVISGLMYLVIPELIDSIANLIVVLPDYFDGISKWIESKAQVYPQIWNPIESAFSSGNEKLMGWLTERVLPASKDIVDGISAGVIGIVGVFFNTIVGFIVMIYMLAGKDTFVAQGRKLSFAVLKKERAEAFLKGCHHTNVIFSKFVSGNLLDSLIVGIICFIVMVIFNWPYAMLISAIIAVTNLIPFFGPFIGGIPSALLLCTEDVWIAIYFAIFITVLQQMDGNIIKPKVLGGSIGLPSFWVMFAIIVGGGLFGFTGMILGVPVFALIYTYIGYKLNLKLDRKQMATGVDEYVDKDIYKLRENKKTAKIFKLFRKAKEEPDEDNTDN